ncbi:MAG TPA: hypothetical protein VIM22_09970 [Solirubrobacteraceae bacterium]|jgi:hypothetical protein
MNMSSAINRLVLVPDRRPSASQAPVRRYRIARLRVAGAAGAGDDRFEHIKHVYD